MLLPITIFANNKIKITDLSQIEPGIKYTFHIQVVTESNTIATNFYSQLKISSDNPLTYISENLISIVKGTNLEKLTLLHTDDVPVSLTIEDSAHSLSTLNTNFPVLSPEIENNFSFLELSEVMFNTKDSVYDWFEFYNNSENAIDLQNKIVALTYNTAPSSGEYFTINQSIPSSTFILQPKSFVVFAEDLNHFRLQYPDVYDKILNHEAEYSNTILIPISDSFPDLTANSTHKFFSIKTNTTSTKIGWGYYTGKWGDKENFSLERKSYNTSCLLSTNWHLSYVEGGTPGKINSQSPSQPAINLKKNSLTLSSPIWNENLETIFIQCNLSSSLKQAQLSILSSSGQVVNILSSQTNLQTNQDYVFPFSGKDINKNNLPIGLYFVVLQGYDENNHKIVLSKILVIAKKL